MVTTNTSSFRLEQQRLIWALLLDHSNALMLLCSDISQAITMHLNETSLASKQGAMIETSTFTAVLARTLLFHTLF